MGSNGSLESVGFSITSPTFPNYTALTEQRKVETLDNAYNPIFFPNLQLPHVYREKKESNDHTATSHNFIILNYNV